MPLETNVNIGTIATNVRDAGIVVNSTAVGTVARTNYSKDRQKTIEVKELDMSTVAVDNIGAIVAVDEISAFSALSRMYDIIAASGETAYTAEFNESVISTVVTDYSCVSNNRVEGMDASMYPIPTIIVEAVNISIATNIDDVSRIEIAGIQFQDLSIFTFQNGETYKFN